LTHDAIGISSPHEEAQRAALAEVETTHPGWQCWPGVIPPLLYARRPRSSPSLVVRAGSPQALGEAIETAEAERTGGAR
jgi:hypothetical protein